MTDFKLYNRRTQPIEMRLYVPNEEAWDFRIFVSAVDKKNGSPKAGDMIARSPADPSDQWLISAEYFADNFEVVS